MVEDIVNSMGYLCLGSRFRRIGERLQADTQQIIDRFDVNIQAAHYPFLTAIDRAGPLTVGELAQAVGITQPGATRTVSQLLALGYVDLEVSLEDQRRRMISLTPKGQALLDYSKQVVWPHIEQAVIDVCKNLSGSILEQLGMIEAELVEAPLIRRGNLNKKQKL